MSTNHGLFMVSILAPTHAAVATETKKPNTISNAPPLAQLVHSARCSLGRKLRTSDHKNLKHPLRTSGEASTDGFTPPRDALRRSKRQ